MNKKAIYRFVLLLLCLVVISIVLKHYFGDYLKYDTLLAALEKAGVWGVFIFAGAALIGTILHIPAYLFIACSFLFYNGLVGLLMGLAVVVTIFTGHYFFGQLIGFHPPAHYKHPLLEKTMQQLSHRPVKSIMLLRLLFFMSPVISFALGLSDVQYKKYLIGSLLGITLHFTAIFLLVYFSRDWVIGWLT